MAKRNVEKVEANREQVSEAELKLKKSLSLLPLLLAIVIAGAVFWSIGYLISWASPESKCASALLPEWRDSCYYSLAKDTMNSSYCDFVNDTSKRDACLSEMSLFNMQPTEASCSKITDPLFRNGCFSMLAKKSNNLTYCSLIGDEMGVDQCYADAAVALKDPSACAMIRNLEIRYTCKNNIYQQLAVERGDPSLCQQVEYYDSGSRQLIADNCVLAVSTNHSDTSMCRYIVNEKIRTRCTGAGQTVDCESIAPERRGVCYYSSAIANNNQYDCGKIPTESLRNNCYYQIATKKRDASICEYISNTNLKNLCRTATGGG